VATRDVRIGIRSNHTFDRVHIRDLITSMDDAIDQMHKTAKAIVLFEMTSFEPEMQTMADGNRGLHGVGYGSRQCRAFARRRALY
jgi:uncharacterized protein Yka (UPF0111/DUF47 family)